MHVTSGLFDHMVLQRVKGDVCDALFEGVCKGSGPVLARVTLKGKVVKRFAAVKVGVAARGKFSGRLKGLPVGGPYEIELTIAAAANGEKNSLIARDLLVGDVWILAGQSNMQGCGWRWKLPRPHAMVRAFYMDDKWGVAQDPIHPMDRAVDPVHRALLGGNPGQAPPGGGAGPGVSFAQEMHRRTGVPQGVIACAHGGTSLSQWDPAMKKLGGNSLYGAMVRRFRKNGAKVAGVVWYQGCNEAHIALAPEYTKGTMKLINACRRDFGNPRLPFAVVQMARVVNWFTDGASWNSVQEQQRQLGLTVPNLTVVPAIDLPLDDNVHLSGEAQHILGGRLAEAMCSLTGLAKAHKQIEYRGFKIKLEPVSKWAMVEVTFANVVGKLRSEGLPRGFEITDEANSRQVYDIRLDGNKAILRTTLKASVNGLPGSLLYYGLGTMPICNIVDEAGRSLPVFGPVELGGGGRVRSMTRFFNTMLMSDILPLPGGLRKLRCPDLSSLKLTRRMFPELFCSLHKEFSASNDSLMAYFVLPFTCSEQMRLNLLLGYDGPIKAWLDGREVYFDPAGIPPAFADSYAVPVKVRAGLHKLVVAMDSHRGRTWGMWLRMQRLDVPKANPRTAVLPEPAL